MMPPKHFVGANRANLLRASPIVKKLLYARLEALSPQDAAALAQAVTPAVAPVLAKVLPELQSLMQRGLAKRGGV